MFRNRQLFRIGFQSTWTLTMFAELTSATTFMLTLIALGCLVSKTSAETSRPKPNIVMIAIDDLNNWVGYLDGPSLTPNIDSFANKSFQFLNAYAASPTCNSSRVALMVGQRPVVTGIFGNINNFRDFPGGSDRLTIPEYLRQQAGYETVAAGKVFHRPRLVGPEPDPRSDPRSWDLQNSQFVGTGGHQFYIDSNDRAFWLQGQTSGSAYLDKFSVWAAARNQDASLQKTWQTSDWKNAQFAADYLSQSHNKPFFLAVGFARPHAPFLAPKYYIDLVDSKYPYGVPVPWLPPDDLDDVPTQAHFNFTTNLANLVSSMEQSQSAIRGYLSSIAFVDAAVGHVVEAVENSAYADNTIIVIWSDHGLQLGEKQRWEKFELWRKSTRVPLLIHLPEQATAVRLGQSVSLLDIYPTITDLAGIDPNPNNHGSSVSEIMSEPESDNMRTAIVNMVGWNEHRQGYSVHQNGWHYIRHDNGTEELYNHQADPNEFTNLTGHPRYDQRKRRLGTELCRETIRVANHELTGMYIPTTGLKFAEGFDNATGTLNQQSTWTTRRFGFGGTDFVVVRDRVESARGRLVATVDNFVLDDAEDFVMSTDVKFTSGGIGTGIVFGYQNTHNYFEFNLTDGRLYQNDGQDVVLRRWSNGVASVLWSTSELSDVNRNETYTLIADYDSSEPALELLVLDGHKNTYFRSSFTLVMPVDSQFGISSFYNSNAQWDDFRLLVNPSPPTEVGIGTPPNQCDSLYDVEHIDSFDDLDTAWLNQAQAGWTTRRFGADNGPNSDFIVNNGRVKSVRGRLVATRDGPEFREGDEFLLVSKVRFGDGGIGAGVVFGFEDALNYYEFDLTDGRLPQNDGQNVALWRWDNGVRTVLWSDASQPYLEYGQEYTLVIEYVDADSSLKLTVLDESKNTYFERSLIEMLRLDSQFGISSYYHDYADWDYFRILTGEDVIALSEQCLEIR